MVDYAAGLVRLSDHIGPRLLELEAETLTRVRLILEHIAPDVEQYAQENASWEDRTGEAREGLQAQVQQGDRPHDLELVLFNESDHGIWLEIAMSGKYQIIMPTLDYYGPIIMEEIAAGLFV